MSQVQEETEVKGGIWMPVEDYAALLSNRNKAREKSLLRRFKDMLNPNSTRTRETFASVHVKRVSPTLVWLWVTRPGVAGESAPRIVKRAK